MYYLIFIDIAESILGLAGQTAKLPCNLKPKIEGNRSKVYRIEVSPKQGGGIKGEIIILARRLE